MSLMLIALVPVAGAMAQSREPALSLALESARRAVPEGTLLDAEAAKGTRRPAVDFLFIDRGRVRSVRVESATGRVLAIDGKRPPRRRTPPPRRGFWDRVNDFLGVTESRRDGAASNGPASDGPTRESPDRPAQQDPAATADRPESNDRAESQDRNRSERSNSGNERNNGNDRNSGNDRNEDRGGTDRNDRGDRSEGGRR